MSFANQLMSHHSLESFHSSQPDGNLVGILRILLVLVTSHTELASILGNFRQKLPEFLNRLETKNILLPTNDGKNDSLNVSSSVYTNENGNNNNSRNSRSNSSSSSSSSIDCRIIDGAYNEDDDHDDDNHENDGNDLLSFLYRNCLFPEDKDKLVSSSTTAAQATRSNSSRKYLCTRTGGLNPV